MSLEWYGVLAIIALLIIAWLGWIDRPGKPPRLLYPEGCGAAARFCDSHTCECRVIDKAGTAIGLGDFRPDCKGPFGKFAVVKWERDEQ